jgi:glycosyltransferase involved in cell wall biosynthesis
MQRILFLLPSSGTVPVGGFKVVFEYANRFISDNTSGVCAVTLVLPAVLDVKKRTFLDTLLSFLRYLKISFKKGYTCKSWFNLDPRVKELYVYKFHEKIFKNDDIVIATAAETAVFLMRIKRSRPERRYYFIQNYEKWAFTEELLIETWKAKKLKKIVISSWLLDIAKKYNQNAELIENGFDFDYFKLTNPIENRSPFVVSALYHTSENKGFKYALGALKIVKNKFPDLKCLLFGVFEKPDYLPDWFEYYHKPDKDTHNMIYNTASIFIGSALLEGFGLTLGEAMQCGCAVAATNIGGYSAVCKDKETALLCEPSDITSLSQVIIKLIADNELRTKIAHNGHEFIKLFTWDRAYSKLKAYIEST